MSYKDTFFYEYVNIRVDKGMSKYKAITHYLNNTLIPEDYKDMTCIEYEYHHSLTLEFSENIYPFLRRNQERIR